MVEQHYLAYKHDPNLFALDFETFQMISDWRNLRKLYIQLRRDMSFSRSLHCDCCGRKITDKKGGQLQVDHIRPRSKWPELSLDLDNFQLLCRRCNFKKSNLHDTDYRKNWIRAVFEKTS